MSEITKDKPLISVIIPVYNVEKYIERCLNSVLHQSYNNLEIILVNDGSTDSSPDICTKFKEKNSNIVLINKKNGGPGSARNAGLYAAHGDFIAFLDSDDWVTPDCYQYLLSILIQYQADVSDVSVYQVKNENETIPAVSERIETYSGLDILEHYLYRGMIEQNGAPYTCWRKLYKKDLFTSSSIQFDEQVISEDICFNFRILRKCSKIVISNQAKYFYFQGNASITVGKLKKRDLSLLKVTHELVELAEETDDKKIIELAKMKDARSDFSLLAKAAKYGIDDTSIENSAVLVRTLNKRLRKNLGLLMRSPMSAAKKGLAAAFVLNYGFCNKMIGIFLK